MSHDQRPGRIRVVQDAPTQQRRRGDNAAIGGVAETAATAASANGTAPSSPALPLVPALLFLLACIGGGVAVALLRPFGIG